MIPVNAIGITERAVQLIAADLEAAGYLTRERVGRRNRYTIDPTVALRHPSEADHPVGDLLATFLHLQWRVLGPAATDMVDTLVVQTEDQADDVVAALLAQARQEGEHACSRCHRTVRKGPVCLELKDRTRRAVRPLARPQGEEETGEPDEETSGQQPAIRTPGYRAEINLSANGCTDVTEAGRPPAEINGSALTAVPTFPLATARGA
jgi:hypothetical protein